MTEYPLHSSLILSVKVPSTDPSKPLTVLRKASVPSPSVVSPGEWQKGMIGIRNTHQVLTYSMKDEGLSGQCGAVYLIQLESGCRIGEVLRLTTNDIVLPCTLLLLALKRSRPRAIRLPELQEQLQRLLPAGEHCLFNISYSQVYRQYLNAGIVLYNPPGSRRTVTHTPRREYIQAVHNVSQDIDTTRDVVGHKSRSSTLTYLQKGTTHG